MKVDSHTSTFINKEVITTKSIPKNQTSKSENNQKWKIDIEKQNSKVRDPALKIENSNIRVNIESQQSKVELKMESGKLESELKWTFKSESKSIVEVKI